MRAEWLVGPARPACLQAPARVATAAHLSAAAGSLMTTLISFPLQAQVDRAVAAALRKAAKAPVAPGNPGNQTAQPKIAAAVVIAGVGVVIAGATYVTNRWCSVASYFYDSDYCNKLCLSLNQYYLPEGPNRGGYCSSGVCSCNTTTPTWAAPARCPPCPWACSRASASSILGSAQRGPTMCRSAAHGAAKICTQPSQVVASTAAISLLLQEFGEVSLASHSCSFPRLSFLFMRQLCECWCSMLFCCPQRKTAADRCVLKCNSMGPDAQPVSYLGRRSSALAAASASFHPSPPASAWPPSAWSRAQGQGRPPSSQTACRPSWRACWPPAPARCALAPWTARESPTGYPGHEPRPWESLRGMEGFWFRGGRGGGGSSSWASCVVRSKRDRQMRVCSTALPDVLGCGTLKPRAQQ